MVEGLQVIRLRPSRPEVLGRDKTACYVEIIEMYYAAKVSLMATDSLSFS